jgi:hypothetical protein
MDTAELPDAECDALTMLLAAVAENPAAERFEHDDNGVIQHGDPEEKRYRIDRETIRALNHRGLVEFDRSVAPRWVFQLAVSACEFTA